SHALFLRIFSIGCVLTAISNFPSGFTATSLNTAVHLIDSFLNDSFIERDSPLEQPDLAVLKSTLNNVWYAAQILGAIPAAFIADRMGRKFAYITATLMMTGASALQTLSTLILCPELLIGSRALIALFSPLSDTSLVLYLQESSPMHLRGTLSSLFVSGYAVMYLLGMALGSLIDHSLPLLLFIPVPIGIISVIFLIFLPETPKYLLSKGDKKAAFRSLAFFQGKKEDHISTIEEWNAMAFEEENTGEGSIKSLLSTPHLRRAFFLSISALFLTLPFVPIQQNSTHFFVAIGIDKPRAQLQSTLLMVLYTVSSLISTTLMDVIPRRKMLLIFAIFAFSSLFVFSLAAQFKLPNIATFAVFFFQFAYGVGIEPVAWCLNPELVPLSHRLIMFCTCFATHSIMVVLTNFLALPLFDVMGGLYFVLVFILPSFLFIFVLYLYLPETAGKELY
ncbi:hypothetical protein PMAYCL1PPCAC_27284, partial [Pristionchus mayeri]